MRIIEHARWLVLIAALAASPSLAQTRIADLQRYHAAMKAMEDIEDISNSQRYRAGLFDGLLDGTLESLAAAGQACMPSCRCDLREAVTRRLASDRPAPEALAIPWLQRVLRESFPCPERAGQAPEQEPPAVQGAEAMRAGQ